MVWFKPDNHFYSIFTPNMHEHPQATRIQTTDAKKLGNQVNMENTDHTNKYTHPCDGRLQPVKKLVDLIYQCKDKMTVVLRQTQKKPEWPTH